MSRLAPASHLKGRKTCKLGSALRFDDLVDYYGFVLRRDAAGQWALAGEWFCDEYVSRAALKQVSA